MRYLKRFEFIACPLVSSALFLFCAAASRCEAQAAATLFARSGTVEGRLAPGAEWRSLDLNASLQAGESVRVGADSRAAILFSSGLLVRLAPNSLLRVPGGPSKESAEAIELDSGKAYLMNRGGGAKPRISTPVVSAAIRGTELAIEVSGERTTVSVIDGTVECSNRHGAVILARGEQASTERNAAPQKSLIVDSDRVAQWVIRYPAAGMISDYADFPDGASDEERAGWRALLNGDLDAASAAFSGGSWRVRFGQALVSAARGDIATARAHAAGIPAGASAGVDLFRARLALSAGEVEEARALLSSVEAAARGRRDAAGTALHAAALSQQAIVELAMNHPAAAAELVNRALDVSPSSASALAASSYLSQSNLDLEAAARSAEKALASEPASANALARLAELRLGADRLEEAKELIEEAVSLAPADAYPLAIAGFIALFMDDNDAARADFERAIELDSSLSQAWLGLGLARIKAGELEEGRLHIQQAVSLDPRVAAYRSYLGKAYFEQENEGQAAKEYEDAIALDPRDPTPYLYRGFNELSRSRPVLALRDVERSIELNGNRAIYRSSLLLDRDSAVRGAGLAQVFTQLGFSRASRIEAIKSLNRDYSNYSAHRLLADSVTTRFFEDAGLSERRITDLLAPLSFNTFFGRGSEASLNEYDSLFDKSEDRTLLEGGLASVHDRVGARIFTAGKSYPFGYFLDAEEQLADGSKEGSYERFGRFQAAGQYQLTFEDRMIVEAGTDYNRRRRQAGDLPGSYSEIDQRSYNASLGYNRRLGSRNTVIAEAVFSSEDNGFDGQRVRRVVDAETFTPEEGELRGLRVDQRTNERPDEGRLGFQHIFDSSLVSTVAGVEGVRIDAERSEDSPAFRKPETLDTRGSNDFGSSALYAQSTLHLASWADLVVGGDYSEVESELNEIPPFVDGTRTRRRFDPKFGLILTPEPWLTLRGAYFETLRKASLENQTSIRPTLVAGLPEISRDLSGTESRNFGAGVDLKLPSETYIGIEGLRRRLNEQNVDYLTGVSPGERDQAVLLGLFEDHINQDFMNGYIYQVLSDRVTMTLDYQYLTEKITDPEIYQEITGHRFDSTVRYFDPSGVFAFARAEWRQQQEENSEIVIPYDFWTYGVGIGYRFPHRRGSILLEGVNLTDHVDDLDQSLDSGRLFESGRGVRLSVSYNF